MELIHTLFEENAKKMPDANAVTHGNRTVSYQQLDRLANQLAQRLLQKKSSYNKSIALCFSRSIEQLIAIYGILKAGSGYVPLDPNQSSSRIHMLLDQSDISIVVTTEKYQSLFSEFSGEIIVLTKKKLAEVYDSPRIDEENLAYTIYTSGSTGVPKGVLIEHGSVVNYSKWLQKYANISPLTRIDYSSNYIFDMAVTTSIVPLMHGASIVICDDDVKKNPHSYLHFLKINQIHCIKITPSFLRALVLEIENEPIDLPDLRVIILGGENLLTADCEAWLKYFPHHILFNEYGPTETTVAVSQEKITIHNLDKTKSSISIGIAAPGAQLFMLDALLQPISEGEIGELYIGGRCLARGYNNQPELTAKNFINYTNPSNQENIRLYKTGDLLRLEKNNALYYLGRMDKQIKIMGYRVELNEIENHLLNYDGIQSAVVLARVNHRHEKDLIAYIILKSSTKISPQYVDLRNYLRRFVPDYMIPRAFIEIEHFPLTENGKLDEKELPEPLMRGTRNFSPPRTRLESRLCKIWEEELKLESVGIDDDFYELGGHSLNAARITSMIQQSFNKTVSLSEFYNHTTIATLADLIRKKKKNVAFVATILNGKQGHPCPLSDFQLLLWLAKVFEPKANKLNLISRKRFKGLLNITTLQTALKLLIAENPIFLCRIKKFYPAYSIKSHSSAEIFEKNIPEGSEWQQEEFLLNSLQKLIYFDGWGQQSSLILLHVYKLKNDNVEIQLAMPHLIADEYSINIIWGALSNYYQQAVTPPLNVKQNFAEYVLLEQQHFAKNFEEHCVFWESYLNQTKLFSFSEEFIVKNMDKKRSSYSTYHELPNNFSELLRAYCSDNHQSVEDLICAAVSIALKKWSLPLNDDDSILINMVKSTRYNQIYDRTVGCFLRIDPIKIQFNKDVEILALSQSIREKTIEIIDYLNSSSILKLAYIAAKNSDKHKNTFIKMAIGVYANLLKMLKLDYRVLEIGSYFSSFKRDDQFIVYVNLWSTFLTSPKQETYFGLNTEETPILKYDLSSFDNICDISFIRENKQLYLVISSNLTEDLRKKIAGTIDYILTDTIKDKYELPA